MIYKMTIILPLTDSEKQKSSNKEIFWTLWNNELRFRLAKVRGVSTTPDRPDLEKTTRLSKSYKVILSYLFQSKHNVENFLWNFYFSPIDSPLKATKNVSYFIKKALFVLEIFKFVYFRLHLLFFLSGIALQVDSRNFFKFKTSSTV